MDSVPEGARLLVEYEMSQLSAEHHDSLVWQTISAVWGGSLVLMGFVVSNLQNQFLKLPMCVVSILGIILTSFTWYHARLLRRVVRQKYDRCKIIEDLLGLEQHSKLDYPERLGFKFFSLIMLCFLSVWSFLILMILF